MKPKAFKKIRLEAEMSQGACAAFLGLCPRSIMYYEKGEKPIPGPVQRLMQYLKDGVIKP